MNVSIILTAAAYGAHCVNHVEVTQLDKDENGKLIGATVREKFSQESFKIKAKVLHTQSYPLLMFTLYQGVINATGPFTGRAWALLSFLAHLKLSPQRWH
jgi:glycerol-3-phosphate dehydrogenase